MPSENTIKGTAEMIEQEKISLEDKLQKGYSYKQLQKNMDQIETKKNILDDIFLKQNEEISLIDDLENYAKINYIDISIDMGQNKKISKNNYYILPITLRGKGNYNNILSFIDNLGKTKYLITFDALDMNSIEEIKSVEDNQPLTGQKINFVLSLKTYWK